jgi:hypothetical protein
MKKNLLFEEFKKKIIKGQEYDNYMREDYMDEFAAGLSISGNDGWPELNKIAKHYEELLRKDKIYVDTSKLMKAMEKVRDGRKLNGMFKCFKCFYMSNRKVLGKDQLYCKKEKWVSELFEESFNKLNQKLVGISLCCDDYEFYEDYEKFREDVEMEKNKYIFYVKDIPDLRGPNIYVFVTKKESWINDKNITDDDFPRNVHQEMYKKGFLSCFDGLYELNDVYQSEEWNLNIAQHHESTEVKDPLINKQQVIKFMELLGFEYNEEFGKYSFEHYIQDIRDMDSEYIGDDNEEDKTD